MKKARLSSFFYFERKLLEDYLNEQAKQGYHLKMGDFIHQFKYEPEKRLYYHVDASSKRRYSSQSAPNDDYIALFESQGYHFLGNIGFFNIFVSEKEESIFSEEDENEVVKEIFKEDKSLLWIALLYIAMSVKTFMRIDVKEPIYMLLTDNVPFCILIYVFVFTVLIYRNIVPIIKYQIKKDINYTYHEVLKRGDIVNILVFIVISLIICTLFSVNVAYTIVLICVSMLLIPLRLSFHVRYYDKIEKSVMAVGLIGMIFFNYFNNPYILEHPSIKYKSYSEKSSFLEMSWYDLNNNETLILFDIYEPVITDMVLDDLIKYNSHSKEDDTYIFDNYVIVQKENKILRMSKDFYEKDYLSLKW